MTRDEARFSPNVGSLYSFVEVTNWTIGPTRCTFTQQGGITSGYDWSFTGYSQLQYSTDGSSWSESSSEKSGAFSGYGDKIYDTITDYFARRAEDRTVYIGNYAHGYVNGQSTGARAWIRYTVPALPPDATTLAATRNGDTSVTLSWAASSGVKESVRVERSTDGGSYSEIATVSGDAVSYTDSTTSADHAYSYRIRYYNQAAYGAYSEVASVTMAPTAPTSISLERATATNVNVTLVNQSAVATSIQWQASYDGGSTWGASYPVPGTPVTSFTASTSGGTVMLRVRNVNATGASAWLVSSSIVTITPPAAPTLVSPLGVFDMSAGFVTFQWLHNPKDGSAQSAAQLQYSTDGGSSWTTVTLTTAQTHTLSPLPWAAGTTVTWRVRTKGADPSYGDWASARQFTCYQVPSLAFAASNPPAMVASLPIVISVMYQDPQDMACAAASVAVQNDGRTLYTEPLEISGNVLTGQITASELLPTNGETYTVTVTARSGSSLQASVNTTFTVEYVAPTLGTLDIQNDAETGYVSLLASFDNYASDETYTGESNAEIAVDSAALRSITIDGKSVQDGTPSLDAPVPIQVVGGANMFPPAYYAPTRTTNGITVTNNGDGTFTLNGTATQAADLSLVSQSIPAGIMPIHANKEYRLLGMPLNDGSAQTNIRLTAKVVEADGSGNATYKHDRGLSVTFQTSTECYVQTLYVYVASGTTLTNLTVKPQVSTSDVHEWVRYGSIGLKVSGTNKADIENSIFEYSTSLGVTYTRNGDGSITASGTADGLGYLVLDRSSANICGIERGATYTIFTDAANVFPLTVGGSATTSNRHVLVIPDSGDWTIGVGVPSGMTANETFHVWLVKGNVASEPYMPYIDSLTEIPLAGCVLASLPDGTKDVLYVDEAGHVTVEKRTALQRFTDGTPVYTDGTYRKAVSFGNTGVVKSGYSFPYGYNTHSGEWQTGITDIASKIGKWYFASTGKAVIIFDPALSNDEAAALLSDAQALGGRVTPQTIDLGYITMPKLADGCTVNVIASLDTPVSIVGYDGAADAERVSVIRVSSDGSRVQLIDRGEAFTGYTDKYAQLNTDYAYEVVTYAASGAYAVNVIPNRLETTRWFAYWGEYGIAWAMWNPSGSYSLSRPEKKRVRYAGRKWPVSYDSKAMEQEHSMSWLAVDMDDWENGFIDLMNDGGRGVYKSCDGWVFHADFEYNATPEYTSITRIGEISLTITRIDGDAL